MTVDLEELENSIKQLRGFADTLVADLPPVYRKEFLEITNIARLLYKDPAYTKLYAIVKKHFGNMRDMKPKTVGAYFGGCMCETSYDEAYDGSPEKGCSVVCVNSLPQPPDEKGWSTCSVRVIVAEIDDTGDFHFIVMNSIRSDWGLLYLKYKNYSDFPGFTDAEKKNLESLGLREVKLIHYDNTGRFSKDIVGQPLTLKEIKERKGPIAISNRYKMDGREDQEKSEEKPEEKQTNDKETEERGVGGWIGIGVGILLIVVIAAVVMWLFTTDSGKRARGGGNQTKVDEVGLVTLDGAYVEADDPK